MIQLWQMSIYGESNGGMVRSAPSRPVSCQRTEPRCDAQAELDSHVAMVCGNKRLSRAEVKKMACGGAALLVVVTIATVVTLAGGRTAGAGAGGDATPDAGPGGGTFRRATGSLA